MSHDFAIQTKNLTKIYEGPKHTTTCALDDVNLDIPKGSMFALLGPNGAGKSTFINILAGLVNKTSGDVFINGFDLMKETRSAKRSIGIVPQEVNYDPFFTPLEALRIQAGLYGVEVSEKKALDLLGALGLKDKARSYTRFLSGGMLRRVMVAKALIHEPPIVVLDEPTAGVDVELRQQLWAYIRGLNKKGATIVLTTHYLEEAEELCDTIAIINHGKLVTCEPKEQLLSRIEHKDIIIDIIDEIKHLPESLTNLSAEMITKHKIKIPFHTKNQSMQEILKIIQNTNLAFSNMQIKEPDLEDVFLEITGTKSAS